LSTLKKICRPSAFYIQNQQISIVIAWVWRYLFY
jgi:hypothetical protein